MVFTWCKGRNGLRKRNKYTDSWARANCFGSVDQGLKEQDCKIGDKGDWGERHVHRSHGSGHKACGSSCFPSMSTRKCPPQWSHWKTTWIEWLECGRSSRLYLQPAPCFGIVPINGVTMGQSWSPWMASRLRNISAESWKRNLEWLVEHGDHGYQLHF